MKLSCWLSQDVNVQLVSSGEVIYTSNHLVNDTPLNYRSFDSNSFDCVALLAAVIVTQQCYRNPAFDFDPY